MDLAVYQQEENAIEEACLFSLVQTASKTNHPGNFVKRYRHH
jgi:hypothetical protein